jgi:hypothetical protein
MRSETRKDRNPARPIPGPAGMVEAPGIEPGSEAAFHATSTSVVPVLISPEPRPGTRLGFGQPRCMSRPAPRRHRAARLLVLTSGPTSTAEKPVDVRPKPELFRFCYLRSESEGCVIRTYIFPGFTSPGLDSHSHDPRPRRNQYAPMGAQSEICVPPDDTSRRRPMQMVVKTDSRRSRCCVTALHPSLRRRPSRW